MAIKLICIDMDGTLLMDQQNISKENKFAIKKAVSQGVHVAITTGRVYNCAKLYSDDIGLKTPIIASNGAFIGGSNGDVIYNNPLTPNEVKDFLSISKKYGLFSYLTANFGIVSTDELPEDHIYKVLNNRLKDDEKIKFKVINNIDEAFNMYPNELLKGVCLEKHNIEKLIQAKNELKKLNPELEIVSSWDDNFEIMKKGSSKGEAVSQLAKYFNLKRDEIMCIGDSENDLSMIEYAGIGVAMGNAIDKVKKSAQYITAPNTDSGVAKAIEKFVLK
ncbi:HAD family hydrolase,Phosphatase YidA,sugar phosphate phosphatase,Predicted hydrolase (HAD superfamily),Cof-like hydrolase,haloacid dehalogenase-like hydrolase [[Clostridium] sordellii]|uniref:Cof-type HAD-IIB family hydrolase n=1 Tax=Paraclostridium sordellii TaxID=1505 RepID=UPI0005440E77|nr:Cof-type HAD-IIB family hydrolase [Paeniclostridium sordellii]CEK35799.1 HAD family hydrolase,Phosphatase YidA,sugar phosphate phosphatase,Predicted hydrolase (HAD superfamily),Cof-like hydrolase,haloacid dehalogenase-like hydrolase [[Clostridium] sordellii] [Paeniclostridium sordellii]